jgi:hypothetical protein
MKMQEPHCDSVQTPLAASNPKLPSAPPASCGPAAAQRVVVAALIEILVPFATRRPHP